MPFLRRLASLRNTLFRKARLDRELDEEIRSAVATLADRYQARGLDEAAAWRAALAALGDVEEVKEEVRHGRVGAGLDSFLLDLRHSWRGLRKAPGLTAVIVATLALGIGANTAIFSVVRAILLAPLPYRDADRLLFVWSDMTEAGHPRAPLSGPELRDLRQGSQTCADFAAIWANTTALTGEGDPEQLRIGLVTANFFQVLGAESALGRTFRAEDSAPGAAPAILLGWELFERRFGADPSIVGRRILVDDNPTTLVGVMPRGFRLLFPPDSSVPDDLQAWLPFWPRVEEGLRGQQFLRVVGRMRPGVTIAEARHDMAGIAQRISRQHSEYGTAGRAFTTVALRADSVRDIRGPLLALFAGVGILLLIACVNVASLLIARAASRARETALRIALGASRGRLLRQALVDGLLITSLGAAAGLLAGWGGLRLLLALRPESLSRIGASRIDMTVLAFTLGISLLWGLLFSLAPLTELVLFKAAGGRSLQPHWHTTAAPVRYRTRATLIVAQMALSVVLLISAGLLMRAFVALQRVDPGFRTDGQLTFRVAIPMDRYGQRDAFNAFSRELQDRVAAIPGVTGVGAISHLPYDDLPNWGTAYLPQAAPSQAGAPIADSRSISRGLLQALSVPLVEGRFFTEDDQDPRNAVAIIDDLLARRMWPNRSALGQQLATDPQSRGVPDFRVSVVGVVPHLKLRSLVADLSEQIFFPQRLVQRNPMAYVVRAERDPSTLAAEVRAAVAALDPRLPLYDMRPLDDYVQAARSTRRFTMLLAAAFAASALVLTCVGVYGVLAYAVARRRHEFGVRRALGAGAGQVMRAVLREGLGFAAVGCAGGLAAALVTSRLLQSQLYAVDPRDPVAYGAALGILFAGAALACWFPARRAMAISPMDALRVE
jgi:putative ABC transport system permease protein